MLPAAAVLTAEGAALLAEGDAAAAVDRFDRAVDVDRECKPLQWQRGLALYFAGRFAEGAQQFEADLAANGSDVEEVVWKCCCDCRAHGLAEARARFSPCGTDTRPGMELIKVMFERKGRASAAAVLSHAADVGASAESSSEWSAATAAAYASYYCGLFLDACCGDLREAVPHLARAAAAPPDDYMGKMFVMHHRRAAAELALLVQRASLGEANTHSRVILGGWQLSAGHHEGFSRDAALASMAEHHRVGMTTLDMGDIYTGVEELVGEHVARGRSSERRPRCEIHTKLVPDLSTLENVDTAYCRTVLTRSKNRLGLLGPLDLVQFHWWDFGRGDHAAAYGHLCSLREELTREVGVTNYDAAHLTELLDAGHPVASNQVQYSLIDRRVEPNLAPVCAARGVSLLCYGVLAGGFLTDAWLGKRKPAESELENRSLVKYKLMIDELGGWAVFQDLLALCRRVADAHAGPDGAKASIADVCIAWVLSRPAVGAVILGARSPRHVASTVRAAALALSPGELDAVTRFLGERALPPKPPFYGLERDREGPHGRVMRYELNRVGTAWHLAELQRRVDVHAASGAEAWPDASDRAAFAAQLRAEAEAFALQGLSEPELASLGRLREQLAVLAAE